ncbi:MAG: hypothetical protein ACE5LQ_04660 [Candidatus Bipolaricaulia bacterium]
MGRRLRRPLISLSLYFLTLLILYSLNFHAPGSIFALLTLPLAASALILRMGLVGGLGLGLA